MLDEKEYQRLKRALLNANTDLVKQADVIKELSKRQLDSEADIKRIYRHLNNERYGQFTVAICALIIILIICLIYNLQIY